jgi:hypothetical protein
MVVAAPKQIRALSNTGKPKPAYIFKLLRIKGYEPFRVSDAAYHVERVRHEDGSWTDVRLTTDLKGIPITRQLVGGELQDVTWWMGRLSDAACTGCTIADGAVRPIARTVRASKHRSNGRVPEVKSAGLWHVACLIAKLANHGRFGHDIAAKASVTRCHCPTVTMPDGTTKVKHEHK